MPTQEENRAKMRWLAVSGRGDDDQVVENLLHSLPVVTELDQDGLQQLALAREQMSELWLRGVSKNAFLRQTGLTGFPVAPKLAFAEKQSLMSEPPVYFNLWLADKDPVKSAESLKSAILAEQQAMPEDYRSSFRFLVYVDIDTEKTDYYMPYEVGLTPHAICFDLAMPDVQGAFPSMQAACARLSPFAQQKIRFGIGRFALQEYAGMSRGSLYTKRMPCSMGTEWILFKNIHRRAGKLGWFWRLVSRVRDKHDNGQ